MRILGIASAALLLTACSSAPAPAPVTFSDPAAMAKAAGDLAGSCDPAKVDQYGANTVACTTSKGFVIFSVCSAQSQCDEPAATARKTGMMVVHQGQGWQVMAMSQPELDAIVARLK